MLKILFVAPMFKSEAKGGPALRTEITLQALSKVFEVSVVVWSEKQIRNYDKNSFLLEHPKCSNLFIKNQEREANFSSKLISFVQTKSSKMATLLVLLEAKLLLGDLIRFRTQNREKAEFVKKLALEHDFKIIWWSFANLESRAVLLFSKKVSQMPIDIVADTDSVWSRFILRSIPFIPVHHKIPALLSGWKKRNDEVELINKAKIVTAVSTVDKEYYSSISKLDSKIMILRNAISIQDYEVNVQDQLLENSNSRVGVLLMGSFGRKYSPMDHGAKWFIDNSWPIVKRNVPNAQLHIIGIGSQDFLKSDEDRGITVHGPVDSVLPFVSNCKVSIVPLFFESGTRFKILEATALGLLSITTSLGNEGLEFEHDKDIYVADQAETFANYIIKTLSNGDTLALIDNARSVLREFYTFESLLNDVKNIANKLV